MRSYGWIPDRPDQRDHRYAVQAARVPETVDLRAQMPPVYDQGALGSCTAQALAGLVEFDQMKQRLTTTFTPSRLMLYYNERVMEHTVDSDAGASLRDGIKVLAKQGDCPESLWPYDISHYQVPPPSSCYDEAVHYRIVSYKRIPRSLTSMQTCLAVGYPFVIGITVYESFETSTVASTGIVPMPRVDEAVIGGHAMVVCGYRPGQWIVRNSWGASFGDQGYVYLPIDYLLNSGLSSDFWTIRTV